MPSCAPHSSSSPEASEGACDETMGGSKPTDIQMALHQRRFCSFGNTHRVLRGGLTKLGVKPGHYEVVREMCKVVDRHVELGERGGDVVPIGKYDKLRNGFCVVFPFHRVVWDLRTPTAMQSAYLRALVQTPMATTTHVVDDNGNHYVRCDDDRSPLADLHPAAFTVAGLVLCYGAPVHSARAYSKYDLSNMGMADPTEHAHVDRCNRFKDVLAFLQYVHLHFGNSGPSTNPHHAAGNNNNGPPGGDDIDDDGQNDNRGPGHHDDDHDFAVPNAPHDDA